MTGVCPNCKTTQPLDTDGTLAAHTRDLMRRGRGRWFRNTVTCYGAGRKPVPSGALHETEDAK